MLRTITIASLLTIATANGTSLQYWPQWRGPLATGEAPLRKPSNRVERRTQHRMEDKTPWQRSLYTNHLGRSYFHHRNRTPWRQTWSTTSSTNWSPQQQGCHPETQFHCPRRLPLYGTIFMEKDSQGRAPQWQHARNRHLGLSLNSN